MQQCPTSRHVTGRDAADGARWIRSQRLLLGLAITGGLVSVAYMMTFSILVLYATDLLRGQLDWLRG